MDDRKEYVFHRDSGVTWSLVFEAKSGQWHIEKRGERGERVQMSLEEFERSPHGRKLSGAFEKALNQAQSDA
jgi:hypothetical protein